MEMELFILLIIATFASKQYEIAAKNGSKSRGDYVQKKGTCTSQYIGVTYQKYFSKWRAERWSKSENRMLYSGCYENEEIAAHVSDTLARKLMKNGEHDHKLNFPEKRNASKYIGVSYNKDSLKWCVRRGSKNEKSMVYNGYFNNEETAAHASDTLARKLMKNGEKGHKLNFPDDHSEVYPKKNKSSKYFGVCYNKNKSNWCSFRWSKNENRMVFNGYYDNEETAARASDTLARKLMQNAEQNHRLNFPDDDSEVHYSKKKKCSKYLGVSYNKDMSKWYSFRHSKRENKIVYKGYYDNEETAARASDILAERLMKNGEQNHRLNFPDDDSNYQMDIENTVSQKTKIKRSDNLEYPQDKVSDSNAGQNL